MVSMYINVTSNDENELREAVVNESAASPVIISRVLLAILDAAAKEQDYEREQSEYS